MRFITAAGLALLCSFQAVAATTVDSPPLIDGFGRITLESAARNIVETVADAPAESVAVFCSKEKATIGQWVLRELKKRDIPCVTFNLSDKSESAGNALCDHVNAANGSWGFVFLAQTSDAQALFELIGNPFDGLLISEEHLFSDWTMPIPGLIRLMSADRGELERFRENLRASITGARDIHITTDSGTDIHVTPRTWITDDGEIYTAVVEYIANGKIFIDGCAYSGPPEKPFTLKIKNGRVINLDDLDETDSQQGYVRKDLARDENANVLAELGIGTSINSRWDSHMMEAEQARGTCHFGFGRNIMFEGGQNESANHQDYIIRKPTIVVDGVCICKEGEYVF